MDTILFNDSRPIGLYGHLMKLGYKVERAEMADSTIIRITSPSGKVWMSGKKMSYPMNSYEICQIANNKQRAYILMDMLGVRIPKSVYVNELNKYALALMKTHKKVIVKPVDGYHSKGVTVDVETEEVLRRAISGACEISSQCIVQEQVEGEEYRFTLLGGKVVSVLQRKRPQIIGNGVDSIRQLVLNENQSRHEIMKNEIISYPQWTSELMGVDLDSEEVLTKNEIRILSRTTLVSEGASVYELINEINKSYLDLINDIANVIGTGFVAVDMFLLDHTEPIGDNYWFNECNIAPSLKMYRAARNYDCSKIIEDVVREVDKTLNI